MEKQSACVHGNAEFVRFEKNCKPIVFQACKRAMLRRCEWEAVENPVLEKHALGRIEYGPARNVKSTAYYYSVAGNCAMDELGKRRPIKPGGRN